MHIFWTIYLGILGTVAIAFLVKGLRTLSLKVDFVISIITWIGLFGFVTNTSIFNPLVWKIVFVCGLLWDVLFSYIGKHDDGEDALEGLSESTKSILTGVTLIITLGPLYYGIYRYAF
ncbi:hypothetical protein [Peribacillus sp. NPDC097295]|uniref:hypothetical protein n=1 Tax=Peribacillus sp. NPDC097295 TaxID=3364402 RepID=UPI0038072CA1